MVDEDNITHRRATPAPPHHPVLFVGAGPGDPELITIKGRNALRQADFVIYAGSLVPEALLTWARDDARVLNSANMDLTEIVSEIESGYRNGKRVVRLHTGDPSLYGAIYEQMTALRQQSIPYAVIPGVSAAFAASAALGIEYTLPEITQTLILTRMSGKTPVPDQENLASLATHQASMVIYLSMTMVEEMAVALKAAYGRRAPCAVVYRASHPDQKVIRTTLEGLVERVRAEGITRQAVVIVGKPLGMQSSGKVAAPSRLYDKNFSHMYRRASKED